jgi:hypothetical protein
MKLPGPAMRPAALLYCDRAKDEIDDEARMVVWMDGWMDRCDHAKDDS